MNGGNTRQLKISRELQRDLAEIIRRKGMAFFGGAMVSVMDVDISPDLSVAKVYVSVFPSGKAAAVMSSIEENLKAIRGELGHEVGKQLRIVPELIFVLDTTLDYAEHIDDLLKKG
ncbi:MAG: 30S ribosome-binding factor RbfA [Bacteroidales bacterium]|jgi:ribosome-binding factor A|nr:30S ribosome-binding factor RbfA [Bacteroidales bacterium]